MTSDPSPRPPVPPVGEPVVPDDALLRLDNQLCFALYAASNLLTRRYRPLLGPLGLTYPQYLVLLVLWEASPQSVGDLGARLYLDSGTLTPLLKRMAAAGLLIRRRDHQDERRVLVELTDKGRALKDVAREVPLALAAAFPCATDKTLALRDAARDLVSLLAGGIADGEAGRSLVPSAAADFPTDPPVATSFDHPFTRS